MRQRGMKLYWFGIRSIPVLFFSGMALVILGNVQHQHRVILIGTAIFFLAGAVWGLFNGGGLFFGLKRTIEKQGRKSFIADTLRHPIGAACYAILMICLLVWGLGFVWLSIHALLSK